MTAHLYTSRVPQSIDDCHLLSVDSLPTANSHPRLYSLKLLSPLLIHPLALCCVCVARALSAARLDKLRLEFSNRCVRRCTARFVPLPPEPRLGALSAVVGRERDGSGSRNHARCSVVSQVPDVDFSPCLPGCLSATRLLLIVCASVVPCCLRTDALAKLLGRLRLALNAPVRTSGMHWFLRTAARLSYMPTVGSCPKFQLADASGETARMLTAPAVAAAPDSPGHAPDSSFTRYSASATSPVSTRFHSSFTPVGFEDSSPTATSRSLIRTGSALLYFCELSGDRQSCLSHGSYWAMDAPGRPQIGAPKPDEAQIGENDPELPAPTAASSDQTTSKQEWRAQRLGGRSGYASRRPSAATMAATSHQNYN